MPMRSARDIISCLRNSIAIIEQLRDLISKSTLVSEKGMIPSF